MDMEIVDDLRAQAMAAIGCWIHRDEQGFNAVVGPDEDAAVLLPIVIGELVTALERCVGPHEVHKQVDQWLSERRTRLGC